MCNMNWWMITQNDTVKQKFSALWKLVRKDIKIKEGNVEFAKSILKTAFEYQIITTYLSNAEKNHASIVKIALSAIKCKLVTKQYYNNLQEFHAILTSNF